MSDVLLGVRGLTLDLLGDDRQPGLVRDVSFDVAAASTVGLIGESGCGKTMTAHAVLGLLPRSVVVQSGTAVLDGQDLLGLDGRSRRAVLGRHIGAVFQEPMSSLNPTMRVGDQIAEVRRMHLGESAREAGEHAVELLERVGFPFARRRAESFPFELSGGMQQRVMIAMAIACNPKLLVADEPTTALDVTIQAEILDLLRRLQAEMGMGILLVTHDLGVVAEMADEVVVMYAGQVVERGSVRELFRRPLHPYTAALLGATRGDTEPRSELATIPGRVPPAGRFPSGCRFRTRCPHARDVCAIEPLVPAVFGDAHETLCVRVAREGPDVMAQAERGAGDA